MKFLLLFMFVAVALAAQESKDSSDQLPKILAEAFEIDPMASRECVNKTEATEKDMQNLSLAINISDADEVTCELKDQKSLKKATCAMVCCAQKKKLMVGGEVQVEEMSKYLQEMLESNIEGAVPKAVRTCKEQVTDTSDECMVAFEFAKCFYRTMRKFKQNN